MARHVFFSFHYQRDIFRVNQIRNLPEIIDDSAAGLRDSSLWEEAKKKSDDAVKKLIEDANLLITRFKSPSTAEMGFLELKYII